MIAVITGDIINSDNVEPKLWLPLLKGVLNKYGKSPEQWEIYRGDSFQLELKPEEALYACILIKATIKQIQALDVRMAIGIGEKEYEANNITESNGSAFVYSGRAFEALKKNNLTLGTSSTDIDFAMNTMIGLALLVMDNWTTTSAESIKMALENPNKNQNDLAKMLNKKQSNISGALNRGGYSKILNMLIYYKRIITEIC